MEVDYARQNAINSFKLPDHISVLGAGGLGTWVSYLAAISGVSSIQIFTPSDATVRPTDAARFPFLTDVDLLNRGAALAKTIQSVRPDCRVQLRPRFVHHRDEAMLRGAVFNCASDVPEFDTSIYNYCCSKQLQYITGGYIGLTGAVSTDLALLSPATDPQPCWAGTLATVASLMLYASTQVSYSYYGQPKDFALADASQLSIGQGVAR